MQWPILTNHFGFSSISRGYFFIFVTISLMLGAKIVEHIVKKFKTINIITTALFITAISIMLSIVNNLYIFISFFIIHEIARGIINPIREIYINDNTNDKEIRSTVHSIVFAISSFGMAAGLLLNGFIAEYISFRLVWLLAGTSIIVSCVFIKLIDKRNNKKNYDKSTKS